jgi:hypothetical protein
LAEPWCFGVPDGRDGRDGKGDVPDGKDSDSDVSVHGSTIPFGRRFHPPGGGGIVIDVIDAPIGPERAGVTTGDGPPSVPVSAGVATDDSPPSVPVSAGVAADDSPPSVPVSAGNTMGSGSGRPTRSS